MRTFHRLLNTVPVFAFLLALAAATASAQEPFVRFGCPNGGGACDPASTLGGVETGADGKVVVARTTGGTPSAALYTAQAAEVRSLGMDIPLQSLHLDKDPTTGWYVALRDSGQLLIINPELTQASYLFGGQSLRDMPVDSSPLIFNAVRRRNETDPASVQHQLATYGDIAVYQRGQQIFLFVTGVTNRRQFVLRVRFDAPSVLSLLTNPVTPNVKAAVTSTVPAEADVPAGVAASPLGYVLTTLPICGHEFVEQGTCAAPYSVAIDFGPEALDKPIDQPDWDRQMTSRGMTADASGNIFVALGPVGALGCSNSGLVRYAPRSGNMTCYPTVGDASTGPGTYQDVALAVEQHAAYVPVTFQNDPGAVYRYSITDAATVGVSYAAQSTDFDGDGKTDLAVRRYPLGQWSVVESSTGQAWQSSFGMSSGADVPGDYNGDRKADLATWWRLTGEWWWIESRAPFTPTKRRGWGAPGDIPVPADYDGDGKCDLAVWRPTDGAWFVLESSTGLGWGRGWGSPGDLPVPGDYDGDGKTDLAVWRPVDGAWFIIDSSTGAGRGRGWGAPGDIPVPADYDGDGKTDIAVWRGAEGAWFIINSSTGTTTVRGWGSQTLGDIPVPGDYDGDGRDDLAVWRGPTGAWFIINSSTGVITARGWGAEALGDVPVSSIIIRK